MPGQEVLATHYGSAEVDTLRGQVAQVSPVLDTESRMFKATLSIANDSLAIRPGMFMRVDVVVASKDSALVIPKEVIIDRGRDESTSFVVDKGLALERSLETGLSNRFEIEVLSGLEVGEQLVVEGFETLRNRSKVKITNVPRPEARTDHALAAAIFGPLPDDGANADPGDSAAGIPLLPAPRHGPVSRSAESHACLSKSRQVTGHRKKWSDSL